MSADGPNIIRAFRQVRQVCEQVSLLLQTADEQMKKAEWKTRNSTALSETTTSILNPRQWIPCSVFRFYFNQKKQNLIACISVLLTDHFEDRYALNEPVVAAMYFDYGKGRKVENDWEYWYARYFGYLSQSRHFEPNGEAVEFDNKKLEADLQVNFEIGVLFAIPLVSLKNGQDIKLQVTDKLLSLLNKSS
jgi:hypothetical protein